MKLLHIDSSALGNHSVSRQLTADIVAELKRATPGVSVTYHDLAAQPLPHWSPVTDANSAGGTLGNKVLEEFLAADIVVLGAPMYNFTISSNLKAWLDRILVAGKTFRYTEHGPEGLAGGKRVIVASSRGGIYRQDSPAAVMDFQEPYLRAAFNFIGIQNLEIVRAEGMAMGDQARTTALQSAHSHIDTLVARAA
ncbi:MAG TPA: FMN-dependent NADH-azoreductase [Rhodanobacter sp.]